MRLPQSRTNQKVYKHYPNLTLLQFPTVDLADQLIEKEESLIQL
jgi:hypothetical protein